MGKDIGTVILGTTVYRTDERYGPKPGRLPNPIKISNYTPFVPPKQQQNYEIETEWAEMFEQPPLPEKQRSNDATMQDIIFSSYDDGRFIVIQNPPDSYSRDRNE